LLDPETKLKFLCEGLKRYPEARETVDYFQKEMIDAMEEAFRERAGAWRNFEPTLNQGSLESGKIIGANERYLQCWIVGTVRGTSGRTWLNLGLYWKAPRLPNIPVAAACHASGEKGVPLQLANVARDNAVRLGPLYKRTETRLFVEAGDDFDPAEKFRVLLEAADDALGAIAGAGQRPGEG
jgi:hypothetical protein